MMIREGLTISEGAILKWLIDSGASKHMCNDKELFMMLVPHCVEVEFGNWVRVRVYYKGTIILRTEGGPLEVSEVLLVPSLATNLFSVTRACGQGAWCTFLENNAGAYVERSNCIVCTAAFVNNLYRIEEVSSSGESAAVSLDVDITARASEDMRWHQRFQVLECRRYPLLGFSQTSLVVSVAVLAEPSLRSTQKLFIFII